MSILPFGCPLSLTQQASHPHSPRDSARQGLLLAPPGSTTQCHVSPHPQSHPLTATPVYSMLRPQLSTFTSVSFCFCTLPPQWPRPHREQGTGSGLAANTDLGHGARESRVRERGHEDTKKEHKEQQTTHTQPQQPKPGTEAADPRMRFWGGLLYGETVNLGLC